MRRGIERMRGGTLIELLGALAVFALRAVGLLNLAGESVRTAFVVEQRALAEVVADNRAVEAALLPAPQLAQPASGSERAGEREWRWQRNVRADGNGLVHVRIEVRDSDGGQVLAERELLRAPSR
jgi:general secretion pathway protein I